MKTATEGAYFIALATRDAITERDMTIDGALLTFDMASAENQDGASRRLILATTIADATYRSRIDDALRTLFCDDVAGESVTGLGELDEQVVSSAPLGVLSGDTSGAPVREGWRGAVSVATEVIDQEALAYNVSHANYARRDGECKSCKRWLSSERGDAIAFVPTVGWCHLECARDYLFDVGEEPDEDGDAILGEHLPDLATVLTAGDCHQLTRIATLLEKNVAHHDHVLFLRSLISRAGRST